MGCSKPQESFEHPEKGDEPWQQMKLQMLGYDAVAYGGMTNRGLSEEDPATQP